MAQSYVCGKTGIAVKKEEEGQARYKAMLLLCKSWACEPCRQYKAKMYRERIKQLFDGRPLYMYTLTYYHNNTPQDAWRTYNEAWNRLRTTWSKLYGKFSYVRVLESHEKSPYPHLHVVASVFVPISDFGRLCVKCGFGYQVKAEKVTNEGASYYISKYLTKEWTNEESKRLRKENHCRIISFSADIRGVSIQPTGWTLVGKYASFADAVSSIYADAEFRHDTRAIIRYCKIDEQSAEISFEFQEVTGLPEFLGKSPPHPIYYNDEIRSRPLAE